ncbi:MAG: hypothetical protein R2715_21005 [Ilumatobacteraceae bacterium]
MSRWLAIVEVLSADHQVDLLGPEPIDVERTMSRLGCDVSRCGFRRVVDDAEASAASADYDVFVTTTYLSKAANRAPVGLYYAHFPADRSAIVPRPAARVRHLVAPMAAAPPLPGTAGYLRDRIAAEIPDSANPSTYHSIIANSEYTATWIRRYWDVEPDLLYPLRAVDPVTAPAQHDRVRGSVLRPEFGHCKKQLELVHAFRELCHRDEAAGWEYHVIGGCDHRNREYFNEVRKASLGYPIHLHLNAPGSLVLDTVGSASILWHGAGEDLDEHPDRRALRYRSGRGCPPAQFRSAWQAGPAEVVLAGSRDDTGGQRRSSSSRRQR